MNETAYNEFVRSSSISDIVINLNAASGGWFGGLLLLFVWFLVLSITNNLGFRFSESFVSASFIATILGVLMFSFEIITMTFLLPPIILLVIGLAILLFK